MKTKHSQKLIIYNLLLLLFMTSCYTDRMISEKYREFNQPENNSLLIVDENEKYYFVIDEDYKKQPKVRKDTADLKPGDILVLKECYLNK